LQNRIEPFPQKIRLTAYNMVKLMIIIMQDRRSYIQGVREGSTHKMHNTTGTQVL